MPVKDDREYRNFQCFDFEKRAEYEDKEIVDGYASTFDEYELRDFGDEVWTERIMPTAFDEADMSDVIFLKDHTGTVFARTKNNTISLMTDGKGLFTKTDLSKTSSARAMYEEIATGMYTQMSFAFKVSDQHFEEEMRDGKRIVHRVIDKISKVFDISAVSRPANPTTEIGAATRAAFDGAIEELKAERLKEERAKNQAEREKLCLKLKLMEEKQNDN